MATAADVAVHVFPAYSLPRRYLWLLPRIRLLTWGTASPGLRAAYGVDWSPEHQRRFERTTRLRWLYRAVPGPLRRRSGTRQRRAMIRSYHERADSQLRRENSATRTSTQT